MRNIAILLATENSANSTDDTSTFIDMLQVAGATFVTQAYSVLDRHFPKSATSHDGFILLGRLPFLSLSVPLMKQLLDLVREIRHHNIPLFGSCFGHLAIAKALGGEVSENSKQSADGPAILELVREDYWKTGIDSLKFSNSPQSTQVVLPPYGARVIATSNHCPIAAMAVGDNIFSTHYQPEHFSSQAQHVRAFAKCITTFFEQTTYEQASHDSISQRCQFTEMVVAKSGTLAMEYFRDISSLEIDRKGVQDLVSNADRAVEELIRAEINSVFPFDGIVGEEYSTITGSTGFDWVIDPIDGTANFVRGIPNWTISIACVQNSKTVIGSVSDPLHDEHFFCRRNFGAFLNGQPIRVAGRAELSDGLMGIGSSTLADVSPVPALISSLIERDSMFVRSGSGALGLAYVACGRYIGYMEDHMNAYDCLAGILLVEEAGGIMHGLDFAAMMGAGSKVVAASPEIFREVREISRSAFGS